MALETFNESAARWVGEHWDDTDRQHWFLYLNPFRPLPEWERDTRMTSALALERILVYGHQSVTSELVLGLWRFGWSYYWTQTGSSVRSKGNGAYIVAVSVYQLSNPSLNYEIYLKDLCVISWWCRQLLSYIVLSIVGFIMIYGYGHT